MEIIAKSRAFKEPLLGKARIHNKIEIQLYDDFDNGKDYKEAYETIINTKEVDILCVHVPIISGFNLNIEFVDNLKDAYKLEQSVILAGELSRYYNYNIKVVIHTAFNIDEFIKFPRVRDDIYYFFDKFFYRYPLLEFCFENVTPIEISKLSGDFKMRNGIFYDNIKLATYLNEVFRTNRFGTVLDTAHLLITIRIFERIFYDNEEISKKFSIEDYFKKNKDIIKLIHLADVKNLGFNKGEHGIRFDKKEDMKALIDLYKKYNYDCDITIEIAEDDYIINKNFENNFKMLNEILNEY